MFICDNISNWFALHQELEETMDCLILRFIEAEPMYRKNVEDLPQRCYDGKSFKLEIRGIKCTFERIIRANGDAPNRSAILISRQNFDQKTLDTLKEKGWKELTKKQVRWVLRKMKEAEKAQGKKLSYAK